MPIGQSLIWQDIWPCRLVACYPAIGGLQYETPTTIPVKCNKEEAKPCSSSKTSVRSYAVQDARGYWMNKVWAGREMNHQPRTHISSPLPSCYPSFIIPQISLIPDALRLQPVFCRTTDATLTTVSRFQTSTSKRWRKNTYTLPTRNWPASLHDTARPRGKTMPTWRVPLSLVVRTKRPGMAT